MSSLQESNRLVMLGTLYDQMGEDLVYDPDSGPAVTISASVYDSEDWRLTNPASLYGFSYRPSENAGVEVDKRGKVKIRGDDCYVVDVERDGEDVRLVKAQLVQR